MRRSAVASSCRNLHADQEYLVRRLLATLIALTSVTGVGCAHPGREVVISRSVTTHVSPSRAGIAVVATGGVKGWEHVTVLDSATARYVTVTRRVCAAGCTPIDSSMGTLTATDVDRIYAIADSERAY